MDLINDLSSDVAFAVLVEKRHQQKIDLREARSLIARIESELANSLMRRSRQPEAAAFDPSFPPLSH